MALLLHVDPDSRTQVPVRATGKPRARSQLQTGRFTLFAPSRRTGAKKKLPASAARYAAHAGSRSAAAGGERTAAGAGFITQPGPALPPGAPRLPYRAIAASLYVLVSFMQPTTTDLVVKINSFLCGQIQQTVL
jgi:hypothetical protein